MHLQTENPLSNFEKPTCSEVQVLVIGAGASGLSAAYHLKMAGINVKILEARNRVGGRVHSIEFGSEQILMDLGASWIHGLGPGAWGDKSWDGKLNPIYQLAQDLNIKTTKCWDLEDRKQVMAWWKGGDVSIDVWHLLD